MSSVSEIKFQVHLDDQSIPDKIEWDADHKDTPGWSETKSISISLWDHISKNSLRMDLWSKEMPVDEMKRFYVDCVGGLAQSILNATGDEYMAKELNEVCDRLVEHVRKEFG